MTRQEAKQLVLDAMRGKDATKVKQALDIYKQIRYDEDKAVDEQVEFMKSILYHDNKQLPLN